LLVQELRDVGDLLVGELGKRRHSALGTSRAQEAGELLPAGVS
jgi:hypothetical protein